MRPTARFPFNIKIFIDKITYHWYKIQYDYSRKDIIYHE